MVATSLLVCRSGALLVLALDHDGVDGVWDMPPRGDIGTANANLFDSQPGAKLMPWF